MMVGTVMVVIHGTLFTVTTTVVLGAPVDAVVGTDVVVSVQKEITFTARPSRQEIPNSEQMNSRIFVSIKLCLQELSYGADP